MNSALRFLAALVLGIWGCANSDELLYRTCSIEGNVCAPAGSEAGITPRACFATDGPRGVGYCAPFCGAPCDEDIESNACADSCEETSPDGASTACFAVADADAQSGGYLPLCLITCVSDDECPDEMICGQYRDFLGTEAKICLTEP